MQWMEQRPTRPFRRQEGWRQMRARPDEFGIGRLFERVPDGVVVADVDTGLITLWNPGAQRMFGYEADQIVGRPIEALMPERYRPRHARGLAHYQATHHGAFIDQQRVMQLPALDATGREFDVEMTLSPLDRAGTSKRYVLAILRDVTDRRRAEEAAARTAMLADLVGQAGLAANEEPSAEEAALRVLGALCDHTRFDLGHLYLVGAGSPALIATDVWCPADRLTHQPFREATTQPGFDPDQGLPGRALASGQLAWVEDLTSDPGYRRGAVLDGLQSGLAFPIRVGPGVVGVLELFSEARRPPEPDLAEALAQVGTQLGRAFERQGARREHERAARLLEERVRLRTAALEAANREIEAFSYSVSHDLRAPLRAMDGFSQIVLEDYADQLPAPAQEYLQLIRQASQQMAQLIDDMLRLSRVSRVELAQERVDLAALVRSKVRELQRVTPRPDLELDVAEGCPAHGDAQLLKLLVGNLVENAWKFTQKTAHPRIAFGCEERDCEPVYFVRDNGVGFNMAYVGQLFKPFSRLHKPDEFEGTGIGLATVHRIVSRHGGRVWAEGSPGGGATFYFTLPDVGRPA
jgi:PAS domain S-box-containing protein